MGISERCFKCFLLSNLPRLLWHTICIGGFMSEPLENFISVKIIRQSTKQVIFLALHSDVRCSCDTCRSNRNAIFNQYFRKEISLSNEAKAYAIQGSNEMFDPK